MLHTVEDQQVLFLHGAYNGSHHAFREEVMKIGEFKNNLTVHFRYADPSESDKGYDSSGSFSEEFLAEWISKDAEVYLCGPSQMLVHVYQTLKKMNHPMEKVHYEFFGPKEELEG